jgi:predicted dehydrogenase
MTAAYGALDGCEVVANITPRDEAALTELLGREDVDLISVHSPPFLHLDHVRRAIAEGPAGRAVLCDKPMGRNAQEAAEMERLAGAAGVVNLVNYEFRIHPLRWALREQILSGVVGPIEHLQLTQHGAVWGPDRPYRWTFDASLGGGWVRAAASHTIDFLRWTLGEVTDVSAMVRTTIPRRADARGVLHDVTAEDGFVATLRTEAGTTITIDTTSTGPINCSTRVTVIGRDGLMELLTDGTHEVGGRILLHTTGEMVELVRIEPWGDIEEHDDSAMSPWAAKICEAVRGTRDPVMATFADGAACHRIMDLITRPSVPV